MGREPLSRIEKILSNIVGEGSYELDPPLSDAEEILIAILNDETIDIDARDRFCTILLCILNGEEYTGVTMSRAEEILKCISEGEKYDVDEWTYENHLSRVEQLLTDWANAEDPEYSKTVAGTIIHVLDAVEKPAESLVVTMEPKQEATPFIDATTKEPYLSKTASTTGNKRYLDKIVGGTVNWNQLAELDADFWTSTTALSVTVTQDNEFDIKSTNNQTVYKSIRHSAILNHVYLISAKLKVGYNGGHVKLGIKVNGSHGNAEDYKEIIATASTTYVSLATIGKTTESFPLIGASGRTNQQTKEHIYIKDFMLVDITLMFANAPAIADYIYSLEQAEAGAGVQWLKDYGFIDDNYRAYNAGELISAKPTAFTVGGDTYTLGGVDLRGLFKLDSNNNLYCDGDELTPDGELTRKYGIVDLGSLDWRYRGSDIGANIFSTIINDRKYTDNPAFVCVNYVFAFTAAAPQRIASMDDKQFVAYYNTPSTPSGAVYFKNTAYTDATAFKTAMNGVYLVYELATPTTTSSSTPYPNPVDIENGDTEAFTDTRAVPIPVGNESHYVGEYEIEGYESVTVYQAQTQDEPNPKEYEVEFTEQGTVYGGTVDLVSGELSVTWSEIASYAGETLPGRWYSSMDEYAVGSTPSTGAQVVYELATPQTYQLTPTEINMLLNENYFWEKDGKSLELTYLGSNPAMMMQAMRAQNNLLKKQGLPTIDLKPKDPIVIKDPIVTPIKPKL